jgi:hypothetical protein
MKLTNVKAESTPAGARSPLAARANGKQGRKAQRGRVYRS